ncbi:MAG TPA: hypothetical protein VF137_09260 [Candidatus Dormibacteraeota bacterium]
MRITKTAAALALAMMLGAVGCGANHVSGIVRSGGAFAGGTQPLAAATAQPATAHTPAATAQARSASTAPAAKPSPAPTGPYPQFAPGTQPAPATATLSAACVTPGGVETLTIKTVPGYAVTFDAQYADGKDGQKYGGFGYGYASSAGTFGGTWAVAPTAPLGTVTVWVAIAHGQYSAFREPTFTVARSC